MRNRKYFYGEAKGLNADIERHRNEEARLREKIAKYEAKDEEFYAKIYRHYLDLLLQSKAEVVSRIGK